MGKTIKCWLCGKRRVPGFGNAAAGWVGPNVQLKITVAPVEGLCCGQCRDAVLDAAKVAALECMNDLSS